MKTTIHLKATDTDGQQARLQIQKQLDALLALLQRYDVQVESIKRTVTITHDLEVILSDEVHSLIEGD